MTPTVNPPRGKTYTARNSDTGENISFVWTRPKPPTQDDVNKIAEQRRQAKATIAKQTEPSLTDKILTSAPVGYALKAADVLGLNQPWHPVESLKDVGGGMQQVITGQSQDGQQGRVAGAARALRGAMGVVGPPATAVGYAVAPEVTAPVMAAGNMVGKGVSQLATAAGASPEVSELAGTGAGLVAGGLAGHAAMSPKAASIEVRPPETALTRQAPMRNRVSDTPPVYPPKALPQGASLESGSTPSGAIPPATQTQAGPQVHIMPPAQYRGVPKDLSSQVRPAPISQTEVSTVNALPDEAPDTQVTTPQVKAPDVQKSEQIAQATQPPQAPPQAPPQQAQRSQVKPPLPPPGRLQIKPPQAQVQPQATITPQAQAKAPIDIARAAIAAQKPQTVPIPSVTDLMTRNVPKVQSPDVETPAPKATPESTPQEISPQRQQRLSMLQQQVGSAEDEGDDFTAGILKEHLAAEESLARLEQNPKAAPQVKQLDQVYSRIDELENKETDQDLNDNEKRELVSLYQQSNKIENMLHSFLGDETGSTGPDVRGGPKRNFLDRLRFIRENGPDRDSVNPWRAEFKQSNRALKNSYIEPARQIGIQTPRVEDNKQLWVNTYERAGYDAYKGLNRQQAMEIGDILDRYPDPSQAQGYDPKSVEAAVNMRDLTEEVYDKYKQVEAQRGIVKDPDKSGMGYIESYLTHIKDSFAGNSDLSEAMKDALDYHFKVGSSFADLFRGDPLSSPKGPETPLQERGVGNPKSVYTDYRTGELKEYTRDIRKVWPAYIESMGRAIHDAPWLDKAKEMVNQIPEGRTKDLAVDYLRNYARYDSTPHNDRAWDKFTGALMRTASRYYLGFNPQLQELHGYRLFQNIMPNMPPKYFAYGLKETFNPTKIIKNLDEVRRRGFLNTGKPWGMMRPSEKIDHALMFANVFDSIPSSVGLKGFAKMYEDRGFSPAEAMRLATDKTKDVDLKISPARSARLFYRNLGPLRPFTQFKQQLFSFADQLVTTPIDAIQRKQYGQLMRWATGVAGGITLARKGLRTWHLNPQTFAKFTAVAYEKLYTVMGKVAKGDLGGALEEAGMYMVPAGHQIEKGISTTEPEKTSSRELGQIKDLK